MRRKNIIAIEGWEGFEFEPRVGMKPLLEYVTKTIGTRYRYNYIYTPQELEYILRNVPTTGSSLLYMAMHGTPEKINLGMSSEFNVSLSELSEFMGQRFYGFGMHFASCAVMNGWEENIAEFKAKTGLSFVSGFSKYVDFNLSAVVDHVLIYEWSQSRSYRRMFERMRETHGKLLTLNGFEYL